MEERFVELESGVILDAKTNFEWHPGSHFGTWEECNEGCKRLGNDWHCPTTKHKMIVN